MPTIAYRTGTVSVTPGSRIVAGIGTLFMSSQIRPGDVFELGGLTASIESVDSNIQLTLVRPWAGLLPVAGSPYEVRFTSDAIRVMASARTVQQVLESGNLPALANLESASDKLPYFNGPNSAVTTAITALARELLAQPTTQAMRTILGLSSLTSVGLRILGSFSNIGQLPTENRLVGDTYLVNGSVQIFNGTGWTDAGPIVGPAGADGIQVFSTRADAINGAPLLNTNVPSLMIRNMTVLEVRQRNVSTAGTDPLFSTGDGWGITLRLNMNDMFIPVSAVGGTANALTATFPPALTNSVGTRLSIIPVSANTGPATLNGVQLRDMNGALLAEGALIPGRVYQFERMASINAWQMVAEPFGRADATALINSLVGSFQENLAAEVAARAELISDDGAEDQVWTDPAGFVLARLGQRDGKAFLRAMGAETLQFDGAGFQVVDAAGFIGVSFDGETMRVLGRPVLTDAADAPAAFDENGIIKPQYALSVWRKALGNVTQRWLGARVLCIGDSLTAGGSLDYEGAAAISRREFSYPSALARILGANVSASWAAFTGTGGQGNAVDSYDPRIGRGSGWYANGDAPSSVGGTCLTNKTTTSPLTFSPGVTWSRAEVMLYGITAATITLSDGNTTSTHNVAAGSAVTVQHNNALASLSPLRIVRTAGEVSVLSAVCTDAADPRVTVINGGRGGATVEDYLIADSAASAGNVIGNIPADLVIVEFGINDQTASVTPAVYKSRVIQLLGLCPANADRVLVASAPPTDAGKAFAWSLYRAALAEISDEMGLPLVDLFIPFGPRAQLEADGWNTDAVHLNRAGLGEKARIISKLLL